METGRQLTLEDHVVDAKDSLNNTWFKLEETIYLKLAKEDKNRTLGKVKGDVFYTKRVRERHLLKVNQSYGFSINIIEQLGVNFIELYEDSGIFKFPVDVLRQFGDYLHFKDEGFERQLFLPLAVIDKYRYTPELDVVRTQMMGAEWYSLLKPEFEKDYMIKLGKFLAKRRQEVNVYPARENMFRAFKLSSFSNTKVVVLAQDCYHTPKVADGLAFSSDVPTYVPPSLRKIFEAIEVETGTLNLDCNPKLDRWAEQGVLLINTILTVEEGKPLSHAEIGWETFTGAVLRELKNHPHDLVIMLWGNYAKEWRDSIDNGRHLILEAEHPATAARSSRKWENHQCFIKGNQFLTAKGYGAIEW